MPYTIQENHPQCPAGQPFAVVTQGSGELHGCHPSREAAMGQMAALYANVPDAAQSRSAPLRLPVESVPGVHYRSFVPDLEVRPGGEGRTVYGIAVPYNAPTRIDDTLVEEFARGAFNHQLKAANRVKFERGHVERGGTLIGVATTLRDDAAGLYGEWRVSRTAVGDETLALVADGALDQLSIKFRERQNQQLGHGHIRRVKADLGAVAIVTEGAYGELAAAAGVRSKTIPQTAADLDLRHAAERYLAGTGLRELPDHDTELRAIRLGLHG